MSIPGYRADGGRVRLCIFARSVSHLFVPWHKGRRVTVPGMPVVTN